MDAAKIRTRIEEMECAEKSVHSYRTVNTSNVVNRSLGLHDKVHYGNPCFEPKSTQVNSVKSSIPTLSQEQYSSLLNIVKIEDDHSISSSNFTNMAGHNLLKPWIIDSGATDHITCDESMLTVERGMGTTLPVKIPNCDTVPVKNIEIAELPNGLKIRNVLNIPDFKCNLYSQSAAKEFNSALIFFLDFCIMQSIDSRKLIGVGKEVGGLYCLEPLKSEKLATSVTVGPKIWHKRLGHASQEKLQKLYFLSNSGHKDVVCDPCLRAKQARFPFTSSSIKTVEPVSLILKEVMEHSVLKAMILDVWRWSVLITLGYNTEDT